MNRELNLTRVVEEGPFVEQHVLDALELAADLRPGPLVDVGSGVGVPGLVLAIARPPERRGERVVLVESLAKKARFLAETARELGLEAVEVRAIRAEEAGREPGLREAFATATARAVGSVATCLELLLPLCRIGGRVVLPRGPHEAGAELAEAEAVAERLGGGQARSRALRLPSGAGRTVITVEKLGPTPDAYPRRPGVPARRPLRGT